MKSKLLVLSLSMFAMSFVAANGTVDAKSKSVLATSAAIEVNAGEEEVAVADDQEVAAEEIAEVAKAKKAEAAPQDQNSCKSCK